MQSNWHSNNSIKTVILNSQKSNPKLIQLKTIVLKAQYITKVHYPTIPFKIHQT